jgi:hypothetical protein
MTTHTTRNFRTDKGGFSMKRKFIALGMAAALTIACAGCSATKTTSASAASTAAVTTTVSAAKSDMFTDRDYEVGYSDYVTVTLSDSGSKTSGSGVTISGSTVTITKEGTYLFTGTLTDGQIIVKTDDTAKVQIVLSNASITKKNGAAIYVKSADKVFLTTAKGTENTVSSTGTFTADGSTKVDAAVFAKSDLTLNGGGTLTVQSEKGHGIVSKDDLKITSGTYVITAAETGLTGKDSVRVADGKITVTSGKDGIHSENTEDTAKGFVYLAGGTYKITSAGDGISSSGTMTVLDGTFTITTNGGSANAPAKAQEQPGMRGGFGKDSKTTTTTTTTTTASSSDEDTSAKALKSGKALTVKGGTFTIDAYDDALHSNATLTVSGGTLTIASGDDGAHADGDLVISGGTVNITKSYEGVEGATINLTGGKTSVVASDDGLNANGTGSSSGDSMQADDTAVITISGGTLNVNADGDGIDSNGILTVTGGKVYVSGPTNSGNGALDYGDSATISGGTVVAVGAAGMDQNFGTDSTQGSILCDLDSTQAAGTKITLKDSDGNVLASYTAQKTFQSVVVSAAGIKKGETYTMTVGSTTKTIKMTSTIYGTGSQMGGGRMGH